MVTTCDIAVIGGGLAGLAATAALHAEGASVICVEPAPPPKAATDAGADLRSTAVLMPGVALLRQTGVWDRLAPFATELATMRLVALDAQGTAQTDAAFNADEIGQTAFGYNLPNWRFRHAMAQALPEGTVRYGTKMTSFWPRDGAARVLLDNGQLIEARLVIGADGRGSSLRAALGIGVERTQYGQSAVVFSVGHDRPHDNCSTEFHSQGGPLTFVPLPDHEGRPASAVVWMMDAAAASALAESADAAFLAALDQRSAGWFGPMRLLSARGLWPIISQRATRLTGPHAALIAEAAHVVPPIGAQGLNMSLADIACLVDLLRTDRDGLGREAWLGRFARSRLPDLRLRMSGIDLLNRMAQAGRPELRSTRAQLLRWMHGTGPIRRGLMQAGLGGAGLRRLISTVATPQPARPSPTRTR